MLIPDLFKDEQPLFTEEPLAPPIPPNPLGLSVPIQADDFWCWAAVAFGVASFYNQKPLMQCEVAAAVLSTPEQKFDCCGSNANCRSDAELETALAVQGNLLCKSGGSGDWPFIVASIAAGRPIAIRIEWQNKTAHFVVIFGHGTEQSQNVSIADPLHEGMRSQTLKKLKTNYLSLHGRWDGTFQTKKLGTSPQCLPLDSQMPL
jgi:hypothetical protein